MQASVLPLIVAAGLLAAGAASAGGPKPKPPAAAPSVKMQTRPQQAGDRYSFTAVTDEKDVVDGKTITRGDRQVFDLEVLGVGPAGMVVAYTQTAGVPGPNASDGWRASLAAWNGVRVVYETDISGKPLHIQNLPEAEGAYLAALAKQPGIDAATVERVKAGFAKATDAQLAQQAIGNELNALAGMQPRQLFPLGLHELPPVIGTRKDGSKLEVRHTVELRDVDAGACQATLRSVTWTDNATVADEQHTHFETSARLSTADGWVMDMTTTNTVTKGADSSLQTVKVHRDAGPPACKS